MKMEETPSFIVIREDDIRDIELLALENREYLENERVKIKKIADEHFTGKCWTHETNNHTYQNN